MGKVKQWWEAQILEAEEAFHMNEITMEQFFRRLDELNAPKDYVDDLKGIYLPDDDNFTQ